MIQTTYLQTIRDDLLARVESGDVLINNTAIVPVQVVKIATNPTADIQNGIALQVTAPQIASIPVITNVKLRTKSGAVVAEKSGVIDTSGAQFLSITFFIEVKGAV